MPRYRVTWWSKSVSTMRTVRTVSRRDTRSAIQYARNAAMSMELRSKLPTRDYQYRVERYSGHLGGWVTVMTSGTDNWRDRVRPL